ncbi:pseudaminic acid cytidylyltransferase [Subsaximicrobium wynnwilliamsii]|uniref:Pseudaminic acid cytidylyltransferase n=1 Tax=Subsaximicrobium wynnwilliamsii TaxID=291179 RepID=A0A5C6ZJF6_9FLAO|nr:pseudaminic acid cytidylyltransferase [Subsaximicrobium wynnwilliamsii]TXD83959.1 pseudaminic acid cytidylyltransferase [Subsaximicrobium wynnwilliamsii]TXD89699.1 pseudaminic acid cytidylyltransferase [Subsaximicrobium wynnwilliamsii]TXE01684.1 pseudaminic acid cytidylyltransferase [Subsaximicrobium wynnwilliamsii]
MANLAIIPARGGSKRIPRKNIKAFLGKPIIAYSIEAALNSDLFDEVMVSTDDEAIANIATHFGASVPFLRSDHNANDHAVLADVIVEVIAEYLKIGKTFNTICCILPTAPLLTAQALLEAHEKLMKFDFDSVFPVLEFSFPIQRALKIEHNKISMVWEEHLNTRSQDLESRYHDAGQFYWLKSDAFKSNKKLFTQNSGAIIISELEAQDIDTETDWRLAEIKFKLQQND